MSFSFNVDFDAQRVNLFVNGSEIANLAGISATKLFEFEQLVRSLRFVATNRRQGQGVDIDNIVWRTGFPTVDDDAPAVPLPTGAWLFVTAALPLGLVKRLRAMRSA